MAKNRGADKPERSKTERRKQFGDWINMNMYHGDNVAPIFVPGGESKVKGMSNAQRRAGGSPQDKDTEDFLADYQPTCPLCRKQFEHPKDMKITCDVCEPRRK